MIFDLQLSHVSVSQDIDQGQSARQTEILHVQGVFPDIFSLWPSLCRSVLVKTDTVQQGRELLWGLHNSSIVFGKQWGLLTAKNCLASVSSQCGLGPILLDTDE